MTKELEDFEMKKAAARAVTGVLASHPNSTDAHIINLSLTFHGQELLSDTKLELNSGRRYGLIGLNGIGKGLPGVGWGPQGLLMLEKGTDAMWKPSCMCQRLLRGTGWVGM